jgi:hypothetical protein
MIEAKCLGQFFKMKGISIGLHLIILYKIVQGTMDCCYLLPMILHSILAYFLVIS